MEQATLPFLSCFLTTFMIIISLISAVGLQQADPRTDLLLPPNDLKTRLIADEASLTMASTDFGRLVSLIPRAVLYPSSVKDIISLVKHSYNSPHPFKIAARGRSHSCRGQAMVENGVVINMLSLNNNRARLPSHKDSANISVIGGGSNDNKRIRVLYDGAKGEYYADVGAEQLWIDVLNATLERGLAPVSWTDYLYLTLGGTLSNSGISGQSFRYGPQISNVYELDVVTGKGDLITCSKKINQELFYAALGGLGQFGIITRATIRLHPAPHNVKWVRLMYDDFTTFARDQEHLISLNGDQGLEDIYGVHFVEGSLIMNKADPNNWRSSFFSDDDQVKIASLNTADGIVYYIEIAKYYYQDSDTARADMELEEQLRGLKFLPGFSFTKEVSFVEFLNRVRSGEIELQSKGLWDIPHPWLNMFIPKSQLQLFSYVFSEIIAKNDKALGVGPVLFYPFNKNKWDDKMSAVTPSEDVFYTLGLLHSSGFDDLPTLEAQNKEILKYCDENGIKIKQYLPNYTTQEEWKSHFGDKWKIFLERKGLFDPKRILAPGQRIF